MQIYSKNKIKGPFPINFVSAFDELHKINRKLFNIPDIDRFLSFSDRKNVCIISKVDHHDSISFLCDIVAKICISYHTTDKDNDKTVEKNKTILVDAGSGNNLGYVYLSLVDKSLKIEFDINYILDNIIIVRAFTFFQLANIVINEIPKLIEQQIDCKIQIVILDLLDTLISSSSSSSPSHTIGTNRKKDNYLNVKKDFDCNVKLLDELIDNLIDISNRYFVILSYNGNNKLVDRSIVSKFNNVIEINHTDNIIGERKIKENKRKLILKIRSSNTSKILSLSSFKFTDLFTGDLVGSSAI